MIYLDSAAVVKMIREEVETAALVAWLNRQHPAQRFVASTLIEVEVPRALRRSEPSVLGAVASTLARIDRVEIGPDVRATAAAYVESTLRSLDAIHLATADLLVNSGKEVTAFVTYDRRLAEAARSVGLPVTAPGQAD